MELKVYNGEYFERGKNRYLIFGGIILLVVILSALSKNIIGGIFVLCVAVGYVFYLTKTNNIVSMVIGKNGLQVGDISFLWNNLSGFLLEYHTEKKKIHNIVIVNSKNARIYTINDTEEKLKDFVEELSNYIPMLENYEQSTMDKVIRKLKL